VSSAASPPPELSEEEQRKRKRRAADLINRLVERGEDLEEEIKASPDSFPLGKFGEFGESYLVYRMLYEELAATARNRHRM